VEHSPVVIDINIWLQNNVALKLVVKVAVMEDEVF
jgi:hypothetical protein